MTRWHTWSDRLGHVAFGPLAAADGIGFWEHLEEPPHNSLGKACFPANFPAEIISMKNHGKVKSWVLLHCIHITANFLRVQAAKLQHFQPRLGQSRVCSFEPRLQLVSILALSALPKAALKLLPWWAPKGDATRVQQVVVSGWAGLLSAPRLRPG